MSTERNRPGRRVRRAGVGVIALAALIALGLPAAALARWRPAVVMFEGRCRVDCMAMGPGSMPMGTSMADLMDDYGPVSSATRAQRRRASALLRAAHRTARTRFPTLAAARRQGFRRGSSMGAIGQEHPTPFVHFDLHSTWHDGHVLDPAFPESLVYWHGPHHRWRLVGFMFRAPSLRMPPDPVGPLIRWHAHALCDRAGARHTPYQFRTTRQHCRSGLAHYGPTVMVHIYLTHRLRTAFAQDVPAAAFGIKLPKPMGEPAPMGGTGMGDGMAMGGS